MAKQINCNNPKFLGKGGEGIIVRCGDDLNKQYAVKLADPDKVSPPECTLKKELGNGKYINSPFLAKPILMLKTTKFGKTKTKYSQENKYIGQENIIKYYDSDVIGLSGENVQDIKTSSIAQLDEDIKNAKTAKDKNAIIKLKRGSEKSIRDEINNALRGKCLIVVEYCDQGDLYAFIKAHPEYVSDPSLFKDMVYQIFCGLVYLYNKKVCHWDIKPENILVKTNPANVKDPSQDPRKYLFKIADYGTVLLNPIDEIKGRLHDNSQPPNTIDLMTKDDALKFIKQNMTEISSLNDTQQNIDPISLINKQIMRTYTLKDAYDITYEFQSTKEYIPPSPLTLTTFYRDMYAFVLCIYMILNISAETNELKTQNLPMSVLASKKKEKNYIFQYCDKSSSRQAKLLWHIARIVKDIEEKIESQSKALYYIREPDTGPGITYYKPQKVIIDVSHEIYKELYEGIGELFETRIGKTLKKINQRKLAATRTLKSPRSALNTINSSDNYFDAIYEVPDNIEEDLLGKHIVFVNTSGHHDVGSTIGSSHRRVNSHNLNDLELEDENQGQRFILHNQPTSGVGRRGSYMSHSTPAFSR